MARIKGDFGFAGSFESKKSAPITDIWFCETFADVINPDEQKAPDGNVYVFYQKEAIVYNDTADKNGKYVLLDPNNPTNSDSWKQINGVINIKPLSTNEIFAIQNPNIGDTYLNTDDDSFVYFTLSGWKYIQSGQPLKRIAFSTGFEDGLDGFILTSNNDSGSGGTNRFVRGSDVKQTGTHSLYISKNDINAVYEINENPVSRAYATREIDIPIGATEIELEFAWKCEGERNYDYGKVYLIDDSDNNISVGASQYEGSSLWRKEIIPIDSMYAGLRKFFFYWRNDTNTGTQPGFCIDNVSLKYLL